MLSNAPLGWYDSHCHFDFNEFDEEREQLITQLQQAGCLGLLVPGVKQSTWDNLLTLSERYQDFVFPTLGLHPYFLKDHNITHIELLDEHLNRFSNIVAVGECGLDFYTGEEDRAVQASYLIEQIQLAKKHKLPLILHSRKSHDQLWKILREHQFHGRGIIHGFSGSLQQAKRFMDLGFLIGIGGAVTHERAKKMHKLVADLPLEGFVLETDAPDMRPAFALDRHNSPMNIPKIANHIAELRSCDLNQLYQQSTLNILSVLKRLNV